MVLNNSADGDIFSTAFFVLGPARTLELIKKFPGVDVIMVTVDGKVIVSPGLEGKIENGS